MSGLNTTNNLDLQALQNMQAELEQLICAREKFKSDVLTETTRIIINVILIVTVKESIVLW